MHSSFYCSRDIPEAQGATSRVLEVHMPPFDMVYDATMLQILPRERKCFVVLGSTCDPVEYPHLEIDFSQIDEQLLEHSHYMICQEAVRDVMLLLTLRVAPQ